MWWYARFGGLVTAACLVATAADTGRVQGTVRVTTSLTKKRISVPQVYERNVALEHNVTSGAGIEAELRRVVVYIDSPKLASKPVRASMNQNQRRFDPEVVAVPAGSTVSFPNSDPIFHNVFSLSGTHPFDLGNYKQGDSRVVTFDRPGVVQVHCHLHANMSGVILVTPNRWLVQPNDMGEFSLDGIPAGHYTLVAWHKSAGPFRRQIEIRDGKPVQVDFVIPLTDGGH